MTPVPPPNAPPTLETRRLIIRAWTLDDVDDMFAYSSDFEVTKYALWDQRVSRDETIADIQDVHRRYATQELRMWGLVDRESGRFIGSCGYGHWWRDSARAEIGYALARPFWGRGLMSEAVEAMLRYGFTAMALHRAQAECVPENPASPRVLEKAGMIREGRMRQAAICPDGYHDLLIYGILRSEYLARHEGELPFLFLDRAIA